MRTLFFIYPIFVGLMLLTGQGFLFGLEGNDPIVIRFPESHIAGWVLIWIGIVWALPPWVVSKGFKYLKRLVKGAYTTSSNLEVKEK